MYTSLLTVPARAHTFPSPISPQKALCISAKVPYVHVQNSRVYRYISLSTVPARAHTFSLFSASYYSPQLLLAPPLPQPLSQLLWSHSRFAYDMRILHIESACRVCVRAKNVCRVSRIWVYVGCQESGCM